MIALLLAAFLQPQRAETDAACVKCHESQQDDWKGSVHERQAVGCIKCHGADSVDNRSKPHLFSAGFRRGTKKGSPLLCKDCHKEEFAAFDKSDHAENTRDGKVNGCTSCHDFHATAVADRKVIFKDKCSECHKAASGPMRWAERFAAVAERLEGDALKAARIAQHRASGEFQAAPVRPAYNTEDAGPSGRGVAVAAAAVLGGALAWLLRGQGRRAS